VDDAQYGYARLNQRPLLHVEEPIPEQVTFGLPTVGATTKITRSPVISSKAGRLCTHLEPPQTLTKLLTELHVHLPLAHDVLAKFLSHQTPLREARFLLGTAFR